MQEIRVTLETKKQYLADCRADKAKLKALEQKEALSFELSHDASMVGFVIYVPPQLVGYYLTKNELMELNVRKPEWSYIFGRDGRMGIVQITGKDW